MTKCIITQATEEGEEEQTATKRIKFAALKKIPISEKLRLKMKQFNKAQLLKFRYLRDKFSRSTARRLTDPKVRSLVMQNSEPAVPVHAPSKMKLPNGILPSELSRLQPSTSHPSWMHSVTFHVKCDRSESPE